MRNRQEALARDLLRPLSKVNESELERLRARLARGAERDGMLDVAFTTIESPIGRLLLAATPGGLVRVGFESEGHDRVLASLAEAVGPRILEAPARLANVAAQLREYFAGERRRFDVPLDFRLSAGFRQRVLKHLVDIGYGRTESYAEVAKAVGNPKAVRAAGSACGSNPLPIVVPCHRVLRSDGSLGGYAGGLDVKRMLLTLEAAA